MEHETKKRGREEGEDKIDYFAVKTAKTSKQEIFYHHHQQQHYYNTDHHQDTRQEESDESYISSDNDRGKYVGLGVFDFPWLHGNEGMISKSDQEYWNFQDTFWCSLDHDTFPPEAEVEYNRQCLYDTPTTTPSMNKNNNKLEVWPLEGENGLEMESVDCIWSWMLNQPLQQGHEHDDA